MTAHKAADAPSPIGLVTRPAQRESEALGLVNDPAAFFAENKAEIWHKVGDLSDVVIPLNRILVAIWVRPEKRQGSGLFLPDKVRDEDKWQGVSGLVLKMGPHAYEENDAIEFRDEDRCRVGDWVMFRRGEGVRCRIWKEECILLESERSVKMILPRPDLVF